MRARLVGSGLVVPCGSFAVAIRSRLQAVHRGLGQLYADFPVFDRSRTYVDFEVEIDAPFGLRSLVRPQAILRCDGRAPFKPLPASQAMAMLEWGLNWVISSHSHDHLVLHAAAVERGGRALVLAADPGSGKSTLCAALVHRGWRLLSDELALVSLQDGRIRPIARPISLKNASIGVVRALGADIVIGDVCRDTAKGDVAHMKPPSASVQAMDRPAAPAMLVFPRYRAGGQLVSRAEGRGRALIELTRHAFNASVLAGEGFEALCDLVASARPHRIEYGSFDQVLPEIDRLWSRVA
ncbi:MAG: HprK-related kinase A [Burkholderiaceae bacterium]|jgi:HprK-related kinase A